MKCDFPECEHEAIDGLPGSKDRRTELRLRGPHRGGAADRAEVAARDGGHFCATHALWVVAGCHLVTNRRGSDTTDAVRRLLARARAGSRRN